ncbi:telomere length regulation protein [Paragonimus westermani]|uniref:Telomere length regulation protein n=1 Tax=Paragonimus westermani TaxID=34504 RepID=A0A5J4NQ54_9TREM|nr:telomere length regulation protein [Paragonimus westermani]
MQYTVQTAKADVFFQCLLDQFVQDAESNYLTYITAQMDAFVFNIGRLRSLFDCWCTVSPKQNTSTIVPSLEQRARSIGTLATLLANVSRGRMHSKLLDRKRFTLAVLSAFETAVPDNEAYFQLCGLTLGQLALNGCSSESAAYILSCTERSLALQSTTDATPFLWSTAVCYVKDSCLEMCLQPILFSSRHPRLVGLLLSKVVSSAKPLKIASILRLFRRLIFMRYFPRGQILRNMFGSLAELSIHQCSESQATEIVHKVNEELGLPTLRLWADITAIQSTSVEQRVYISQALASWFTDFYNPVVTVLGIKVSQSVMLPDILSGISNHLSSPRIEIRTIGMAVGEFLVKMLDLSAELKATECLKFAYEETDHVKQIKSFFTEVTPYSAELCVSLSDQSTFCFVLGCVAPGYTGEELAGPPTIYTDSDDDPDLNEPPLEPLPQRPGIPKAVASVLSSNAKPRYLRECLYGMLSTKPEDNHMRVTCFGAAADLIYSHPQSAKELAIDLARVFVHVEPPACPDESRLLTCRHEALVALGVVAPKECARYLTNEFCQPSCSLAQRQNIIAAVADIACHLSSNQLIGQPNKFVTSLSSISKDTVIPLSTSSALAHKTRRLCSKVTDKPQTINAFSTVAGDFFFPLLRSIPQLFSNSQSGTFAHQDASLLGSLVATLATLYVCSRFSPCQSRMASELIELTPLLYRHSEPAVRRAVLIAMGTVISTTPSSLLNADPQLFLGRGLALDSMSRDHLDSPDFPIFSWLKSATVDEDSECQLLASVGLSAFVERVKDLTST